MLRVGVNEEPAPTLCERAQRDGDLLSEKTRPRVSDAAHSRERVLARAQALYESGGNTAMAGMATYFGRLTSAFTTRGVGAGHERRHVAQVQNATAFPPVMTCSCFTNRLSRHVGHSGGRDSASPSREELDGAAMRVLILL